MSCAFPPVIPLADGTSVEVATPPAVRMNGARAKEPP
jgi:hypothetical protein